MSNTLDLDKMPLFIYFKIRIKIYEDYYWVITYSNQKHVIKDVIWSLLLSTTEKKVPNWIDLVSHVRIEIIYVLPWYNG